VSPYPPGRQSVFEQRHARLRMHAKPLCCAEERQRASATISRKRCRNGGADEARRCTLLATPLGHLICLAGCEPSRALLPRSQLCSASRWAMRHLPSCYDCSTRLVRETTRNRKRLTGAIEGGTGLPTGPVRPGTAKTGCCAIMRRETNCGAGRSLRD
jgi:hypothetical protein